MKKILVLIALSFMTVSTLTAQMKDPQNWVGYEEIMGVKNGLRFYDFDVNLIESSAPANVFWPGDDIRLKFQLINNTSQSIDMRKYTSFVMERKESPMIFGCPR